MERHGPAEKSAIAASLRLRGGHLGGFLQALEDAGLLVRQNGAYALAQEMSDVLCATSPWCQAKVIDNLYDSSCGWSDLTGFILAESPWSPDGTSSRVNLHEDDAFDALLLAPRQRVALVGTFPPYMRKLISSGLPFNVLERDMTTLASEKLPFSASTERAPEVIPRVDVFVTHCRHPNR